MVVLVLPCLPAVFAGCSPDPRIQTVLSDEDESGACESWTAPAVADTPVVAFPSLPTPRGVAVDRQAESVFVLRGDTVWIRDRKPVGGEMAVLTDVIHLRQSLEDIVAMSRRRGVNVWDPRSLTFTRLGDLPQEVGEVGDLVLGRQQIWVVGKSRGVWTASRLAREPIDTVFHVTFRFDLPAAASLTPVDGDWVLVTEMPVPHRIWLLGNEEKHRLHVDMAPAANLQEYATASWRLGCGRILQERTDLRSSRRTWNIYRFGGRRAAREHFLSFQYPVGIVRLDPMVGAILAVADRGGAWEVTRLHLFDSQQ